MKIFLTTNGELILCLKCEKPIEQGNKKVYDGKTYCKECYKKLTT